MTVKFPLTPALFVQYNKTNLFINKFNQIY